MLKSIKKSTYLKYTLIFLFMSAVIFSPYIISGSSFIWHEGLWNDGYNQHYTSFVYLGRFYRSIISGFMKGDFIIPQFDFTLGIGEGILPTLNYYGFGDVFTLFSALVPPQFSHIMYNALVILRLYLAGAAFIYFCKTRSFSSAQSITGAFIYIFCGYSLFEAVRHPFFLNPMIYLPLIAIGVNQIIYERYFSKLFITAFTLCAASGFYFTYMLTAFAFIYVIILILSASRSMTPLISGLFKTGVNYVISILCSSVIFIPSVIAFLSSSRSGGGGLDISSLFLWNSNEIYAYTAGTFVPFVSDTALGISIAVIPALVLLFRSKEYKALKTGVIICTLAFFIPVGGYIMNGFSYPANRWSFIFSFILAFTVSATLPMYKNARIARILPAFICLNLCLNGLFIYGIQQYNKEDMPSDAIYTADTAKQNNYEYTSFNRSLLSYQYHENMAVLYNKPGISEYFSIINNNYAEFLERLEISPAFISGFKLNGVDNRTVPEAMLCVNNSYYTTNDGKKSEYTPELILPFGYTYDKYISSDTGKRIYSLELQDIMTEYAVLDNTDENSISGEQLTRTDLCAVSFEKSGDTITFTTPRHGEVYLYIHINNIDKNTKFTFTTESTQKELFVLKESHRYYLGKSDFMVNIGTFPAGIHTVTMKQNTSCNATLTEIMLYDTSAASQRLKKLGEYRLENLNINKNTITGNISLDTEKILVLSVPYSKGWTAAINGKPAELLRANYSFCALRLTSGNHNISLHYTTPGIKAGMLLSLSGLVIFLLICIFQKKKK